MFLFKVFVEHLLPITYTHANENTHLYTTKRRRTDWVERKEKENNSRREREQTTRRRGTDTEMS
jgi:hypothetical protein